uniref:Acetolactate synthase n=1 Tax=Boldia erythrosiphon TaxID=74908 RepID=A0A1Y9TLN6_9RHOD|nr:acetohydroxyacid synthetase large subunit [Boldia erythrosiphon]ARO90524.1 acetohydroxyacid synthetase large subunit [Boldia erythrosiphon]
MSFIHSNKTEKTGAFALLDSLVKNNVKYIFGYPGGAILPIYDELYSWEKGGAIKHILVRHEQSAAHAADGYARSTGKIGVCFATSGPGATNLVTGIATAQSDSIPLLAITGQVSKAFIGTDAFQEVDIFGITLPIVKHSYVVRDPRDISRIIGEAFYIAQHGRPGPVLIDIPKDVSLEKFCYSYTEYNTINLPGCRPVVKPSKKQIIKAAKLIKQSTQPLLYIGGGAIISNASESIEELIDIYKIPMVTTLNGKGIINEHDELCLGMLGMHGTAYANFAVSECDLLITLGARFDDRVTGKLDEFACNAQVIHIDIDPAEIGKNRVPQVAIIGDIKEVVTNLLLELKEDPDKFDKQRLSWEERIKRWREEYPLIIPHNQNKISPQYIISKLSEYSPKSYFTTDVGQHQMWAAQFIKTSARKWISSAGLGTMGFGLPAAIGVKIAHPNEEVICISGDASFQMNLQELGTVAQYNLNIKIIIINNYWQGMVRQWQEAFYNERYSHSNMEKGAPDFITLANAYGIRGIQIKNNNEVERNIISILEYKGPVLVDVQVIEEENCYPMVAPGKSNAQMIGIKKFQGNLKTNYNHS